MGWRCSSMLSDDCLNAGNRERTAPGSPPRYSNGNPECLACNAERVYPDKSLGRRLTEALPDWIIEAPEFEPYELSNCQRCGEGFQSHVRLTIHSMEEHSEEINPPTIRVDELASFLDEFGSKIPDRFDMREAMSGCVLLREIREEFPELNEQR